MARPLYRHRIRKDSQGKWRWTLFARNGRKVATSGEGYNRRGHAEAMVMKLFGAALALAMLAACSVTPPPVVTPEPALVSNVRSAATVVQEDRSGLTSLTCRLQPDHLDGDPVAPEPTACDYNGVQAVFSLPAWQMGRGAELRLEAAGFTAQILRVVTAADMPEVTMRVAALNAGERGWLHRDGQRLAREDGSTFQWRGYTAFPIAQQVCDGKDVGPFLDEVIGYGANLVRVMGMFNGGLGRFIPAEIPDYDGCIARTFEIAAARGLRVEFVVFADAQDIMPAESTQRDWLAHVAPILDRWNVVGELVNEYPKNGVDPNTLARPPTRTVWSHGSGLGDGSPALPSWDFLTHHSARVDEWPRRIECREFTTNVNSPARGFPCVEDEPYGAAETRAPGRRVGLESLADMSQWGAVCGLEAAGCTFHSDGGILGAPLGPVQQQLARVFFDAMRWVPADAQLWPYQRGEKDGGAGVGDMPMEHVDAKALRTFCKGNSAEEWCVAIRPTDDWIAVARPGWRIVEQPVRGLVRLTR